MTSEHQANARQTLATINEILPTQRLSMKWSASALAMD
jgi:hypothetical protein